MEFTNEERELILEGLRRLHGTATAEPSPSVLQSIEIKIGHQKPRLFVASTRDADSISRRYG